MGKSELILLEGAEARERVAPLFNGWDETLIWSVLQGCMGNLWGLSDDAEQLHEAVCEIGDFLFVAGEADLQRTEELLCALKCHLDGHYGILALQNEAWEPCAEAVFQGAFKRIKRYAIKKESKGFHCERLQAFVDALGSDLTIQPIDQPLYERLLKAEWSRDFCAVFGTYEHFHANGLGFVAICNNEPVGGASSYTYYRSGIEIEVDTRPDMRRRGIATACCAKLILACIERGLYPSWDAANRASVNLAQKLGYSEKGEYTVYELNASID